MDAVEEHFWWLDDDGRLLFYRRVLDERGRVFFEAGWRPPEHARMLSKEELCDWLAGTLAEDYAQREREFKNMQAAVAQRRNYLQSAVAKLVQIGIPEDIARTMIPSLDSGQKPAVLLEDKDAAMLKRKYGLSDDELSEVKEKAEMHYGLRMRRQKS